MSEPIQDVVIIGGGPAGLTAALYAGRARLDALLLEAGLPGGEMARSPLVEAYPGFPDGISGFELGELMRRHAESFDARLVSALVEAVQPEGALWSVRCAGGERHLGRALIVATGERHRRLGVPGEEAFAGRGVGQHAARDGSHFRDRPVAVIGGGNAAGEAADFLTRFCARVLLVHDRAALCADRVLQERARASAKIEIRERTTASAILGEERVRAVTLRDLAHDREDTVEVQGVFVLAGWEPNSELLRGLAALDEDGYVLAGEDTCTSVPGLFVAGDVRSKELRRPTTAVSDGTMAAYMAGRHLGRTETGRMP